MREAATMCRLMCWCSVSRTRNILFKFLPWINLQLPPPSALHCTQSNCALKCTYLDWTRTYSSFRQSESTVALKIKWSVSMLTGVSDTLQWSSIHLSLQYRNFLSIFFVSFSNFSVVKVICIDVAWKQSRRWGGQVAGYLKNLPAHQI